MIPALFAYKESEDNMKAKIKCEFMQLPFKAFFAQYGYIIANNMPKNMIRDFLHDNAYVVRFTLDKDNIKSLEIGYETDEWNIGFDDKHAKKVDYKKIICGDMRHLYDDMPELIQCLPSNYLEKVEKDKSIIDHSYFELFEDDNGDYNFYIKEVN